MHTVGLVVFPGFQSLALAVATAFECANMLDTEATYDFSVVSEQGGLVASSLGFSVSTEAWGERIFDTLIVAGDNDCRSQQATLIERIRDAAGRSRRVTSICTGAFLLADAGLLDGRKATTHWGHACSFAQRYPLVQVQSDRIYVKDGQIWTSAGMSAGLDMVLALIESDRGRDVALKVARKLVIYQRRSGGQSQFSQLLELDAKSDRVQTALVYAKEHLADDLSVDVLAGAANLSPRQFSRVFREETGQSPAKAVERLRVETARMMMETGRHPIEVIARETGFGDRERMRQAFLRAFGQPPQAIQRVSANAQVPGTL